jgi:hypothetical protein
LAVVASYSWPGTRRRFDSPATTNADGYRVSGPYTDTPAQGHTFAATGDTATRFELQDIAGLYEVHTATELRPADRATGVAADRWLTTVSGRARVFEVVAVRPWMSGPTGAATWHAALLQEVVAS